MEPLIQDYQVSLAAPGCKPGAPHWGALANLAGDISPVLPYLNAVWKGARYDHQNRVLIHDRGDQKFALRPREIRAAWVENLNHARVVIADVAAEINQVWANREQITPDMSEKRLPDVLSLFKRLPGTNCRACGCPTCLAFAVSLRCSENTLEACPVLNEEQLKDLRALLE